MEKRKLRLGKSTRLRILKSRACHGDGVSAWILGVAVAGLAAVFWISVNHIGKPVSADAQTQAGPEPLPLPVVSVATDESESKESDRMVMLDAGGMPGGEFDGTTDANFDRIPFRGPASMSGRDADGRSVRSSVAAQASDINQAMDRALAAADLGRDEAARLIATWRDRTNHEFVRNFAVQHLERYARECVVRGTWDPDSSDAADVRAALEEAVFETGTSVGGAALLALARLSEIDPHVDRARLGARASSLVSDPSAPAANRASAAQVCGLLRVRSALPALRSLSSDLSTPTPLRLAAQHAAEEIEGR